MPKLDIDSIPQTNATGYPPPFDEDVAGRHYRRLAPTAGLTRMGASYVVLDPGAYSSQRHWHEGQDEMVIILQGEATLIEDDGEVPVGKGDILAWPAGDRNGHRLYNHTDLPFVFVAVSAGDKDTDRGEYPDIDMVFTPEGYFKKDGTPYPTKRLP